MNLSSIIFIDSLPTLDLHGFDRDYARIKINEFIDDNIVMGKEFIVIVHGVGTGILMKETAETL
jgi:DNA-nicking Smr family endonuclease